MEDKKLNEQESLELITRMIQNSKRNLEVGSGNIFLLWGYLGAVVPLVIFVLVLLTKNYAWNWLWFLIPLVGWPMQYIMQKKEDKPVITYTDKALMAVWRTIGTMGMLGVFWLCQQSGRIDFILHAKVRQLPHIAVNETAAYKNRPHPMANSSCRTYIYHQVGQSVINRFRKVKSGLHLPYSGTEVTYLHFFLSYQAGKLQFRKLTLHGISNQNSHISLSFTTLNINLLKRIFLKRQR